MSENLSERIAQMLENTRDTVPLVGPYRSGVVNPDPTDATSMTSVPVFQPLQYRTMEVTGTFASTTTVATIIVWRGNYTGTTTPSTGAYGNWTPASKETYTLAATDRSISSSFVSDAVLFSCTGVTGVKISVVGSPAGGVTLHVRRSV